jgi:hypothetical protein
MSLTTLAHLFAFTPTFSMLKKIFVFFVDVLFFYRLNDSEG